MSETIPATEQPADGMTLRERQMADAIYSSMMRQMHDSDRSQQAQEFRVGVSDLGFCSERLRRFLDRQVPDEIDMLPAFHGTWLGEGIEQAVAVAFPEAIIQSEVTITLKGEHNVYEVPGHPDIIFPEGILLDVKSSNGLSIPARNGMDDRAKRFQRHCYAYAAFHEGLFDESVELYDIVVGNVWVDRSADERRLLVKTEPFDLAVIREAEEWLDDVVYAWQNKEEARKEPPREMCQVACGFFRVCRAHDTDVSGLLTDPNVLDAVTLYKEGSALMAEGKRKQKEAKSVLKDISGSTGEFAVRWVDVPPFKVEAHERAGYTKLSLSKLPRKEVR